MTIQYCSDLHLEFAENRKFLSRRPLDATGDILVLAGDIIPFGNMPNAHDFINFTSDHFSAVYWVPGNHEYYGCDIAEKPTPLFEKIRDNFYLVNNQAIVCGNVKILCTTLWSMISPQNEWD